MAARTHAQVSTDSTASFWDVSAGEATVGTASSLTLNGRRSQSKCAADCCHKTVRSSQEEAVQQSFAVPRSIFARRFADFHAADSCGSSLKCPDRSVGCTMRSFCGECADDAHNALCCVPRANNHACCKRPLWTLILMPAEAEQRCS